MLTIRAGLPLVLLGCLLSACAGPSGFSPESAGTVQALTAELERVRATATAAAQAIPLPVTVTIPATGAASSPLPSASAGTRAGEPPSTVPPPLPTGGSPAQVKAATGTAERVVQALQEKALPIGETRTFMAGDDPEELLGRPGGYLAKTAFRDTRLDMRVAERVETVDSGTVEVWPTEEAARRRREFLTRRGETAPDLVEYGYVKGPVLLRLSKRFTPDQAAAYDAALAGLGSG